MKNGLLVSSVKVGAAALLFAGAVGLGGGKASADVPKGAVYTLTNTASGNVVAVFDRAGNGTLTAAGSYATGGNGTGAALGSQNSVIMNNNEKWLFAVDAGSNDIAVFSVDPVGLTLIGRTPSGGTDPISLTVHKDVLYVLNAGGAGNITGFNVMGDGTLVAIPNSTEPLSSGAGVGPAEVQFNPTGRVLVVTEKATSLIDTYVVNKKGIAGPPQSFASSGNTPFGFAFNGNDTIMVSEAHSEGDGTSSVSSYHVASDGTLTTIDASDRTNQVAACWIVVTKNGQYVYSTNAGSGSLTGFSANSAGNLSLLNPDGRTGVTGNGSSPIDAAMNNNSHYLYALLSGTHGIAQFAINSDGSLTNLGILTGLNPSMAGLAAR